MTKNILLCSLSSILMSCAHQVHQHKQVHFTYAADLVKTVQSENLEGHREVASTDLDEVEVKSTRRTYFSALYYQFLTLGNHLEKNSRLNFCPQFHHDKVETETFTLPEFSMYRSKHVSPEGKQYFPELAFNKKFSLSDYHDQLKSELEVLCEEGISDNYYKFDNLVTHYAHRNSFHLSHQAMESVLKIPVFANFYLIKMLQGQGMGHFTHPEEKRVISLTRTHWLEKYIQEAGRIRGNFIKPKMVQR